MKRRICVLPGVGFNSNTITYQRFASRLGKNLGCEALVHPWKHSWQVPVERDMTLDSWRQWLSEVILDVRQVISNPQAILLPEADLYIGHSAGGALAWESGIDCVLMGSPLALLEPFTEPRRFQNVLNIAHTHDIIAHTLQRGGENFLIKPRDLMQLSPIQAHSSYWNDSRVEGKITQWASRVFSS